MAQFKVATSLHHNVAKHNVNAYFKHFSGGTTIMCGIALYREIYTSSKMQYKVGGRHVENLWVKVRGENSKDNILESVCYKTTTQRREGRCGFHANN